MKGLFKFVLLFVLLLGFVGILPIVLGVEEDPLPEVSENAPISTMSRPLSVLVERVARPLQYITEVWPRPDFKSKQATAPLCGCRPQIEDPLTEGEAFSEEGELQIIEGEDHSEEGEYIIIEGEEDLNIQPDVEGESVSEGEPDFEGEDIEETEGEENKLSVPELGGLTEDVALSVLAESVLLCGEKKYIYDYDVPAGFIISQDPLPGTKVEINSKVDLTVSIGRESETFVDFLVNQRRGFAPLMVEFHDISFSSVEDITDWHWDYGDGGKGTNQHPTYEYTQPGKYDVLLTVTNSLGETHTRSYENMIDVLALEYTVIGPEGGTASSEGGITYTIEPGVLEQNIHVLIEDVDMEELSAELDPDVSIVGAASVHIEQSNDKTDKFPSSSAIPGKLTIPTSPQITLPPNSVLESFIQGNSYGSWWRQEGNTQISDDGKQIILETNGGSNPIVVLNMYNHNSTTPFLPEVELSKDMSFSAELKKIPNGGDGAIPIVLIHGLNSYSRGNYGHWDRFIAWAQGSGKEYMRPYQLWWFKHFTDYPIGFNEGEPNAALFRPNSAYEFDTCLKKERKNKSSPFPPSSQPFIIVAHSRGGLVARTWMQKFPNAADEVLTVLTLATPHHGSVLAVPDWTFQTIYEGFNVSGAPEVEGSGTLHNIIPETIYKNTTSKFNWQAMGSADLAWNNFDRYSYSLQFGYGIDLKTFPLNIKMAGRKTTEHTVSDQDAGWSKGKDKDTDLHLPTQYTIYGRGYTLWDLNEDKNAHRFFDKAILYGSYLSFPGTTPTLYFTLMKNATKLKITNDFMAYFRSRNTKNLHYAANDGMVALQSALALKGSSDDPIYQTETKILSSVSVPTPIALKDLSTRLRVDSTRVRYKELVNYNHEDMVFGKDGKGDGLFMLIAYDLKKALESISNEEVVPGEMISIPAASFKMGRPYTDAGNDDELPVHNVFLNRYQIGKYQITNEEFAEILNRAHFQKILTNANGGAYTGGMIYAYGKPIADTDSSSDYSQISFVNNTFNIRAREAYNASLISMGRHPVVMVSWYGAVCYCNWLSEKKGLNPCYDTSTWELYEPVRNGYRLPTEAEWERAAAWDGTKHWRYGMFSDTIDFTRANYYENGCANPLDLATYPYTSSVGWYRGNNPARVNTLDLWTINARSPVGAYDMSGNVWEWCHDWYDEDYYSSSPEKNPRGPTSATSRVLRGGTWYHYASYCRSASRGSYYPEGRNYSYGFRLARTP